MWPQDLQTWYDDIALPTADNDPSDNDFGSHCQLDKKIVTQHKIY